MGFWKRIFGGAFTADVIQSEKRGDAVAVEPFVPERKDEAVARLLSGSRNDRSAAAEELGKSRDPDAIGPLVAALSDTSSMVRVAARDALINIGGGRVVDAVEVGLEDGGREKLFYASGVLRALNQTRSIRPLLCVVRNWSDQEARRIAMAAVAELCNRDAVEVVDQLIGFLTDSNPDVSRCAIAALAKVRDSRAVGPLLDVVRRQRHADPKLSASAEASLEQILRDSGDASALEPLVALIRNTDPRYREFAARILGRIGSRPAVEAVVPMLEDIDVDVRRAAAVALNRNWHPNDAAQRARLKVANAEFDGKYHEAVSEGLAAVAPLVNALVSSRNRDGVAEALVKLGSEAVGALISQLSVEQVQVRGARNQNRRWIMHVLGKIGDARALEPLLEALGNKNPSERGNAADALGESGNACAVEPLCRALGDMSMYEIIDGSGLVQSGVVQCRGTIMRLLENFTRCGRCRGPSEDRCAATGGGAM